jgi:hypothetical protein
MVNSILNFEQTILFLEFFVREYTFVGKSTIRTKLPEDAFFYTGKSKAEYKIANDVILGFQNSTPYLSRNISETTFNKLFSEHTNIICKIGSEYSVWGDYYKQELVGKWHRNKDQIKSNKYKGSSDGLKYSNFSGLSPYHFAIDSVLADGTIFTNFPQKQVVLSIKPFQTLCFLCRREEFTYYYNDFYQPNLNLVLFVKNYGYFDSIEYVKSTEIEMMDSSSLCLDQFDIRDFRKLDLKNI